MSQSVGPRELDREVQPSQEEYRGSLEDYESEWDDDSAKLPEYFYPAEEGAVHIGLDALKSMCDAIPSSSDSDTEFHPMDYDYDDPAIEDEPSSDEVRDSRNWGRVCGWKGVGKRRRRGRLVPHLEVIRILVGFQFERSETWSRN